MKSVFGLVDEVHILMGCYGLEILGSAQAQCRLFILLGYWSVVFNCLICDLFFIDLIIFVQNNGLFKFQFKKQLFMRFFCSRYS